MEQKVKQFVDWIDAETCDDCKETVIFSFWPDGSLVGLCACVGGGPLADPFSEGPEGKAYWEDRRAKALKGSFKFAGGD